MKDLIHTKKFALHFVDSRKPLTNLKIRSDSVRICFGKIMTVAEERIETDKDNMVE